MVGYEFAWDMFSDITLMKRAKFIHYKRVESSISNVIEVGVATG